MITLIKEQLRKMLCNHKDKYLLNVYHMGCVGDDMAVVTESECTCGQVIKEVLVFKKDRVEILTQN